MSCKPEAPSSNPSQPCPLSGGIRPSKKKQSPALTLSTSLSLSFLTCKLGITTPNSQSCHEGEMDWDICSNNNGLCLQSCFESLPCIDSLILTTTLGHKAMFLSLSYRPEAQSG